MGRLGALVCILTALLWVSLVPPAAATPPGPNGKVAFVRTTATENPDIYSVNADGSGLARITNTPDVSEDTPAFSADGNYIAYTRAEAHGEEILYIMRADGTDARFVYLTFAEIWDVTWSPDGTKIALYLNGNPASIRLIGTDGTDLGTLVSGVSSAPSWSPDGSKLAFARGGEIWTINSDGSAQTMITANGGASPDWSPDGSKIVFLSYQNCVCGELSTVPSSGGPITQLTNLGRPGKFDPNWSPDGTKIIFNWCTQGTQCDGDLYTVSADGSGLTALQVTSAGERDADWQPAVGPPLPSLRNDLDNIAFSSTRDHSGQSMRDDIFTVNPDGSTIRPLTFSAAFERDPAWSPTGSKLAFVADRGDIGLTENEDVYVMNPDGTGKTNLTNSGGVREFDPTWSPDGSRIAYGRGLPTTIWVMSADGTGQQSLIAGQHPDWSPDGTRIAFMRSGFIYTVNPDGSGLVQLTSPPSDFDLAPAWSPDGTKIAFTRDPDAAPPNIWVMNADGSGEQQVTSDPLGAVQPTWSPDGKQIAFSAQGDYPFNMDVFVMNADGTRQIDITNALGGDFEPDWRPVLGYPRPRGATPMRVSLVPAAASCTAANRTHGAPLSFGSCSPVQAASQYLTTGTPDANGRGVRMNSFLELRALTNDVRITAFLNDILDKGLDDYIGELRAHLPLRVTDKASSSAASVSAAATTQPFLFAFDIACDDDPGPAGSTCALDTTANALVPGAVAANLRTVWQIGQVRVFDGGADGEASTTADNTVFATQGVFVP